MSIGNSGRIVIELDPDLKKSLHEALRQEGTNLKSWFVENAQEFLNSKEAVGQNKAEKGAQNV